MPAKMRLLRVTLAELNDRPVSLDATGTGYSRQIFIWHAPEIAALTVLHGHR